MNCKVKVPEDISILNLNAGEYDLQRFFFYNIFKCFWNNDLTYKQNVITNFDWYHPNFSHRHTKDEIRSWCNEAGLEIEKINIIESGIAIRVRRLN